MHAGRRVVPKMVRTDGLRSWPRLLAVGAGTLLVVVMVSLVVVVDAFGRQVRGGDPLQADIVVVLGSAVTPEGTPTPELEARVRAAAAVWTRMAAAGRRPLPPFVLTGGRGEFSPTEAEAAAPVAVAAGVSPSSLVLETRSRNTRENVSATLDLLQPPPEAVLVVVSDPYHLLRARQWCVLNGRRAVTVPALRTPRHHVPWARLAWTVREVLALLRTPVLLVSSGRRRTDPGHPTRRSFDVTASD